MRNSRLNHWRAWDEENASELAITKSRYMPNFSKTDKVLSVRDLRKIYIGDPPFTAVKGISFDMARSEILGFLGPNGAGKTTTIQMLIGTLASTSGSIFYFGCDFAKHRADIMRRVSFASTYVSLPWLLTIEQNLNVFGRLAGLTGKQIRQKMDPLLDRFGILHQKKKPVSALSSGQITRLMLAKAFLSSPEVILLDEPTASLDPDMARDVLTFLREEREKRGISILFTSHRMEEVTELCDRVVFLHGGQIVANDRPDVLARSVSNYRLQLQMGHDLEQAIKLAEQLQLPCTADGRTIEVMLDEGQIPRFLDALAKQGLVYSAIKILEPKLEDYFLKMARKLS
jgi:ABC-2 type transport system ATP-binding protein